MIVNSRMMSLLRLLVVCVALGVCGLRALGQSKAGAATGDAVSKLVDVYRAGPVADRVVVAYTAPGAPEARSVVTVRVDAGGDGAGEAAQARRARVRLTLGRLEVYASGEALAAYLRGDARTCFEGRLGGGLTSATLRGALPAVPLPQVQWALGDEASRSSVHPYGLATSADGAEADGTLRFRASDGVVLLKVDARSGRARSVVLNSSDGSVLRLEFTAIDAGDAAAWAIDTKGRTRVATLAELQSHAPVSPVGVRLPELGLVDAELRNVPGAEVRGQGAGASGGGASGGGASGGGGGPVVLMVFHANADGSMSDAVERDAGAALEAAGRVGSGVVAVGALPEGILKPEKLGEGAASVGALAGEAARVRVLFSPSARGFMDKWEPGAGVVLLVLRGDGVVGAMVACDGRDAEALGAELRAGLK